MYVPRLAGELIFLDSSLPAGDYSLSVGMYDAETFDRVAAFAEDGSRLAEDRIVLGQIQVVIIN